LSSEKPHGQINVLFVWGPIHCLAFSYIVVCMETVALAFETEDVRRVGWR